MPDLSGGLVWATLGLSILIRLSFFSSDPVGSDDVYRYVWDGKVQAAGINPYRYAPDDPALADLHSSLLPGAVNHPEMKTVYFPFSQWLFLLAFRIAGESLWGLKAMLLAAEAATMAGLLLLLSHLKLPRRLVLLYALCPLPILAFALDAHVDGFGLPLFIFGLLYHLRGRPALGLVLLGLSMSVKPVALVVLPVLFLQARTGTDRIRIAVLPLAVALLPFVPYALEINPLESLSTFAWHWLFNGAFFELVRSFVQDNQRARLICAAALGVSLVLLQFTRHDVLRKAAFSVLLLLLFSPVVHPWYVTWLVGAPAGRPAALGNGLCGKRKPGHHHACGIPTHGCMGATPDHHGSRVCAGGGAVSARTGREAACARSERLIHRENRNRCGERSHGP